MWISTAISTAPPLRPAVDNCLSTVQVSLAGLSAIDSVCCLSTTQKAGGFRHGHFARMYDAFKLSEECRNMVAQPSKPESGSFASIGGAERAEQVQSLFSSALSRLAMT